MNRLAGQFAELFRDKSDIFRFGIEAGPHGGRPHVHRMQRLHRQFNPPHRALDRFGVSLELLPQRDRHRILQMSASHLEHLRELLTLRFKRRCQSCQGLDHFTRFADCANANGGRDHIVS